MVGTVIGKVDTLGGGSEGWKLRVELLDEDSNGAGH